MVVVVVVVEEMVVIRVHSLQLLRKRYVCGARDDQNNSVYRQTTRSTIKPLTRSIIERLGLPSNDSDLCQNDSEYCQMNLADH